MSAETDEVTCDSCRLVTWREPTRVVLSDVDYCEECGEEARSEGS